MTAGLRFKLSIMMFLQYFVWGCWWVTLGTFLASAVDAGGGRLFSDEFIGRAYGTSAVAAIVAPFFVGLIADQYFATERILSVLHLAGAACLFAALYAETAFQLYALLLLHFLCYMPTLALSNSLSFHHLSDPRQQFPGIRVLGTIGWIVAGIVVGWLWPRMMGSPIEATTIPIRIAAVAGLVLGIYCLFLPPTPPRDRQQTATWRDALGLDALSLLRQFPFAVFMAGSFLICIPLQFYYTFTNPFLNEIGVANAAAKQTYGQMSEIVFMLLMPFFLARLGVKWMLIVSMFCWMVRYLMFAYGDTGDNLWMLYGGILLHGICYDFFFVTGQIYVDAKAPANVQAAAQGLFAFVTLGLGLLAGSLVSGPVVEHLATNESATLHDWQRIWLVPALMAGIVMVIFAVLFRDQPGDVDEL